MIQLAPEHLAIVREILDRRLPGREVWVFGSRARGTARPPSDLDLAVIGPTPLDGRLLAETEGDFSDSDLPFRVDLVDWAAAGERFREIIRDRHEVLCPGQNTH